MLKPRKKLTKKELKSDPLVEALEEGKELYDEYKKPLLVSVGGIIAIILIAWIYTNNQTSTQNEAMLATTKVLASYTANPSPEAVSELEMVVAEYGDVAGAELAKFYLGVAKLDDGEFDVAKDIFLGMSKSVVDNTLKLAATTKLAETFMQLGDYTSAGETYLSAAKIATGDVSNSLKISAAYAYKNAENTQKTQSILDALLTNKISKDNRTNAEYLLGKISL